MFRKLIFVALIMVLSGAAHAETDQEVFARHVEMCARDMSASHEQKKGFPVAGLDCLWHTITAYRGIEALEKVFKETPDVPSSISVLEWKRMQAALPYLRAQLLDEEFLRMRLDGRWEQMSLREQTEWTSRWGTNPDTIRE